jgi:hypothetical protein
MEMWRAFRLSFIITLLGCWTLQVLAADSPAQLVVGVKSIEELLRLPSRLAPGRYAVDCEAHILRGGQAEQTYCYALDAPAPDDLVDAVTVAAARARFVPAVRNGKRIEVYATFMVLVDTTLAEPLILAVPNNGAERRKFGLLYTAPQWVVKDPLCNGPNDRFTGRRPDRFILMQLQVDEHGGVHEVKFHNLTGESAGALRRYEETARASELLPGYYEGRAVAMSHLEPIFAVR